MNQNLLETVKLQQVASDPKNSAWVFASAGSGKTKILVDRVLRLLLSDVTPDKILCLTFTKNAALEMQDRINSELAKWILCDEEELVEKLKNLSGKSPGQDVLKKARTLFNAVLDAEFKIKTQTIHAFCQTIIKIFPFEADVRPSFEVIESAKESLLLKQVQKKLLQDAFIDKNLENLLKKINSKFDEESFLDVLSGFLSKKEKINFLKDEFFGIENVIAEIYKKFSVSPNHKKEDIFGEFLTKINFVEILQLAQELENTELKSNIDLTIAIRSFVNNQNLKSFDDFYSAFFTDKNEPRKLSKNTASNQLIKDLVEKQQILIANFLEELNSFTICDNSVAILTFVDLVLEKYNAIKKQNALLDYNDLIVKTNQLLANPEFSDWIKLKMDSSFDHILIDESQDTNHHQWNIIKALSEDFFSGLSAQNQNRSIFIVGDEKQSIYSFQGAEPNISEEIFTYFQNKLGDNLKKIELNNSFRSVNTVLNAVDRVFSQSDIKKSLSKLSEFKNHLAIRQGLGKFEIWPKITNEKLPKKNVSYEWDFDFNHQEKYDEKDQLAEIIASKIKTSVENKRILDGKNRAVEYGDFMILLRKRTGGLSQSLSKFFHQYQIPFLTSGKIKFSENLLLQDLLSAAKFGLLPSDDLNLACLLKSPFFLISEDDLLEISLVKNRNQSTIYKALGGMEKFAKIKRELDEIIEKSLNLNVFEFYYFLIEEKNNSKKIAAYFGQESLEILDKFLLLTQDFCRNFSNNLQKFLEFIVKIDPEISLNDVSENVVKISTIHAAKGLQAPIVIMPDCSYNFNQLLVTKEKLFFIDDLPIFLAKKSEENQLLKLHKAEKLQAAKDEYLRLLYVAMTRAEDELYIAGYGDAYDKECWYELIARALPEFVVKGEFKKHERFALARTDGESEVFTQDETLKFSNKDLEKDKNSEKKITKALENQINQGQIRGKLIHKIFEIFGRNYLQPKNNLVNLVKKIIAREDFLSLAKKSEIESEALQFLSSELFDKIFFGEIKCEVELVGKINNQDYLLRIDLMRIAGDEILILDYKSDESLQEMVPAQYLEQLQLYKKLVQNIFPGKKISTAILWTRFLRYDELV